MMKTSTFRTARYENILRLAIAFVFTLVLIVAMIASPAQMGTPTIDRFPEASAAFRTLQTISPGQPVLFVADYQAGGSGEMDVIAGAALQHLVQRHARLLFVSTNINGPMQAERLMQKANQLGAREYHPFVDYANLGFIPGGLGGILAFIQNPRYTLPLSSDGHDIWHQPAFADFNEITDVSVILIATENIDTARVWIEQLKSAGIHIPLIVTGSAQLEPVMMAYYEAIPKQIDGLVCGWAAAAAYTKATGNSSILFTYWAPFSYAGLLAIILVLVGWGVSLIARTWIESKPAGEIIEEENL